MINLQQFYDEKTRKIIVPIHKKAKKHINYDNYLV